jgi:two-component system CheB/CheR fusion protein
MTVFGQHDLGQRAPFPRIDLCLCRNVLIYFTRELQSRALQLFAFSLRNGGYLVVGKAESTGALDEYFTTVNAALKIYQREGDRILIPPTRVKDPAMLAETRMVPDRSPVISPSGSGARGTESRLSASETFGSFLANSPVGIAIVDRRYDIVGMNVSARAMLEIHGVGIGEDIVHLARGLDGNDLRELIDAAFRNEAPPPATLPVLEPSGNVERWLYVACSPDRAAAGMRSEVVALLIVDVSESVRDRLAIEARLAQHVARVADLSKNVDDLDRRHKALLTANDELTAANNELRTINEQLQIKRHRPTKKSRRST